MSFTVTAISDGATIAQLQVAQDAVHRALIKNLGSDQQVAQCLRAWTRWYDLGEAGVLENTRLDAAAWAWGRGQAESVGRDILGDPEAQFVFKLYP